MRTATARLEKIEARMPAPTPTVEPVDSTPLSSRLQECLEAILAEEAHFKTLSPAGKIQHLRADIARRTAEALEPMPPDRPGVVPGLAASIKACEIQDVKNGFHSEYYEIRGHEIALLREHGYDIAQLEARHNYWKHLPWQWRPENEMLPADAERLLCEVLEGSVG